MATDFTAYEAKRRADLAAQANKAGKGPSEPAPLETSRAAGFKKYEADRRIANTGAPPTTSTRARVAANARRSLAAPRTAPVVTPTTSTRARVAANARRSLAAPRTATGASTKAPPKVKTMSAMDKVRADKGLMDIIRADAAALRKPAQKAAPKAAAKSSGLSADKSYADYKKLMESM